VHTFLAVPRDPSLIQLEGESRAEFLDLIVRHGKGLTVIEEFFRWARLIPWRKLSLPL